MPILEAVLALVIIGVVLWLINTYIPMAAPIKTLVNVVIVIVLILWLISAFFPGLGSVRVR